MMLLVSINAYGDDTLPDSMTPMDFEPDNVQIIQRDFGMVEEYRRSGTLYMVKIFPNYGYPYYVIDMDGDGYLETPTYSLGMPNIQQWRLFSW